MIVFIALFSLNECIYESHGSVSLLNQNEQNAETIKQGVSPPVSSQVTESRTNCGPPILFGQVYCEASVFRLVQKNVRMLTKRKGKEMKTSAFMVLHLIYFYLYLILNKLLNILFNSSPFISSITFHVIISFQFFFFFFISSCCFICFIYFLISFVVLVVVVV